MTLNPLLLPITDLVDYAAVTPAHIEPAISTLIAESRNVVERIADPSLQANWENIVDPLEDVTSRLWRAWSVAGHLNAVVNTNELRAAYNACLPLVTDFSTWVGLHEGLYAQYKRLREPIVYDSLTPVRRRIIDLALRDFRLSGVELQGEQRKRYALISEQQAQASQKFSENVLDAVDQWSLLVDDESRLAGLPKDVIHAARNAARDDGLQGWKLGLKMPCYLPVMQYAQDRSLRETLYRAYATLASEQGDCALDNSGLIEQLLALRAEEAALLGYENFAGLRLETRMADSAQQVLAFLRDLAEKAKPYAERDLQELRAFASETLGMQDLQAWDIPYASERLRESRYAYSEEEIKHYFTESTVLQGLFQVFDTLFGVSLHAMDASTWHPDVRSYQVRHHDGRLLGHLYMDLHARQGKQSGAWVDGERSRRRNAAVFHTPVVYLTCNFASGRDGGDALLTHDDVITLFHESGHALHALVSCVDDPGAAAFSSVEWDAIELPSQFMENFCWEWPVVQAMTRHDETGERLPRALFDKLLAARNFQSGLQMVRQIEFSLFDMLIHSESKGLSIQAVMQILNEVRKQVAVIIPPPWQRFAHNFSHLFAGGYGAGYYSYKWAEVLSADAYSAFEESAAERPDDPQAILDARTGQRFLEEILQVGGARPASESFQAFRGRAPELDALLRHSGMTLTTIHE